MLEVTQFCYSTTLPQFNPLPVKSQNGSKTRMGKALSILLNFFHHGGNVVWLWKTE